MAQGYVDASAAYNAGWTAAANKFYRSGNTVYGPSNSVGGTTSYSASIEGYDRGYVVASNSWDSSALSSDHTSISYSGDTSYSGWANYSGNTSYSGWTDYSGSHSIWINGDYWWNDSWHTANNSPISFSYSGSTYYSGSTPYSGSQYYSGSTPYSGSVTGWALLKGAS